MAIIEKLFKIFKIFTEYSRHIELLVCQRRTRLVKKWCCNWHWCMCTFSPYTNSIFTTFTFRYLSVYIALDLFIRQTKIYKLTDIISPFSFTLNALNYQNMNLYVLFHTLQKSCHKRFSPAHFLFKPSS